MSVTCLHLFLVIVDCHSWVFNLTKTVVLLSTPYIYSALFCYLSFSLSPCLSLWLSEEVFPRTTHLLLIWMKMAAGHGRYVLENKLHS